MPRPRKPAAKALVEGRHIINAGRYKRNEPTADAIGDPPKWLNEAQAAAWREFAGELPWLNRSHRALLEIACTVRARVQSGAEVGTKALSLLRLCLSSLGATPADASKVSWAAKEPEDDLLD
ncbi:hypothetical protein [Bradyrhizobium yuanmingense]|uniref:hypothetical protein n=1 Tax=Bradyrhizobium yuanmingense TaxID=108015 RepID=UPI00187D0F9E|nr:hypothetical protein [Bradyrhizobium yuanmingense]